ncbi:hypothetical protein GUITHDRAFT_103033 [Guillardia theta CCMP2712]|uniref:EF-hand domain-containing protein n=1 Tax=Guillardia theta (strain CCMP2712) TaxID=905079 RepID=L1JS28_GUITC|nr:hypothetical protein GUITHDRAFT_103033 [Guillardia theta CCMP2712]EKX51114.1 hypothetical protein GUITHDRAFT_103033 [Guillardia theta CCMP2712]|eukprot:XP_005838094.1 hypothetical protein GUITHDRAFT_103033 [Guillardia theta CCMP2712]
MRNFVIKTIVLLVLCDVLTCMTESHPSLAFVNHLHLLSRFWSNSKLQSCLRPSHAACKTRTAVTCQGYAMDASFRDKRLDFINSRPLSEQRAELNKKHMDREAIYQTMKRRIRASSYELGLQDLRKFFSQFDIDKDGVIDWSEFQSLLERMGLRPFMLSEAEKRMIFKEMGASQRNLYVQAREFFKWMKGAKQEEIELERTEPDLERKVAVPGKLPPPPTLEQRSKLVSGWTYGASSAFSPDEQKAEPMELVDANEQPGVGNFGVDKYMRDILRWTSTPEKQRPPSKLEPLAIAHPEVFESSVDFTLRKNVEFLLEMGVPKSKIPVLVLKAPDLLLTGRFLVQDLVAFLIEIGVREERVGRCLSRNPQMLMSGLQSSMISTLEFLIIEGGIPRSKVGEVIEMFPLLMSYNVEFNLRQKINFLKLEFELEPEAIGSILYKFPQLLGLSLEANIKPTTQFLMDTLRMTKEDLTRLILQTPQILGLNVHKNLEPKIDFFLQELGVPLDKLVAAVRTAPSLLTLSVSSNLRPKMIYLTTDGGYCVEDIIKSPTVFLYSMNRMKSRVETMKRMKRSIGLSSLLSFSEKDFEMRFLN